MKKIAIMLAAIAVAATLQVTTFASSGLFIIPSVISVDDYSVDYGRDVNEVLAEIEASAKAELGITDGSNVAPSDPKPAIVPKEEPKPAEPNYAPNNAPTYFGEEVRLQIINGLPMIFAR